MKTNKKKIIKQIVEMMRLEDRKYTSIVLTDEERNMTLEEMKLHIMNQNVKNNNIRCDELLAINEIN